MSKVMYKVYAKNTFVFLDDKGIFTYFFHVLSIFFFVQTTVRSRFLVPRMDAFERAPMYLLLPDPVRPRRSSGLNNT